MLPSNDTPEPDALPLNVVECALDVLLTKDAFEKARLSTFYSEKWARGLISLVVPSGPVDVPNCPARPDNVRIVSMEHMKSGSKKAMIHSIAHAESYAIDLMWDIVARFAHLDLPRDFFDDWVRIAGEEAKHFRSWADRLVDLGSFYGDLPGHDGLWDSARDTANSLQARLAIVHMVHEARGLDTFPLAEKKLNKSKDDVSLAIMRRNVAEEVGHVGAAVRWFTFLCDRDGVEPATEFQRVVRENFRGLLKPPFNKDMRELAGMSEHWYLPLAHTTAAH